MRAFIAIGFALAVLFQAPAAQAAKWRFGAEDRLQFIQKVDVKGPDGQTLHLARKLRTEHFILPYTIADDGYVLAVTGKNEYFSLNDAEIKDFQARRLLPDPLPPYKMEMLDLVMGHLAWIVLAVLGLWIGISSWWKSRKKDSADEAAA